MPSDVVEQGRMEVGSWSDQVATGNIGEEGGVVGSSEGGRDRKMEVEGVDVQHREMMGEGKDEADKCKCQMQMDLDLDLDSLLLLPASSIQPRPTANHRPFRLPPAPSFFLSPPFYFPFRFLSFSFLLHPRPPTQITARVCPFHYPGVSAVCVENKMSLLKPSSRGLF
jgi:hypothetical protein